MPDPYSYPWFIQQFEEAKETAEKFVLSIDEALFLQPPQKGRWSVAECYSHLINYGNLYFDNINSGIAEGKTHKLDFRKPFPPRWAWQKIISFFEPPYIIKLKTISSMKPGPVKEYNRMELLDKYMNLQDQFIAQLEEGQHRSVDLGKTKINHPIISIIKMTLSECFALAEAHQRRHQWQAEQTLKALSNNKG